MWQSFSYQWTRFPEIWYLELIIVCSYITTDTVLILTYFMARSNFYGKVKFQNFAFFWGGGGWALSCFVPRSFRPGSFQSESFRPGSFGSESFWPRVVSAFFGESFRPDFSKYVLSPNLKSACLSLSYLNSFYRLWPKRLTSKMGLNDPPTKAKTTHPKNWPK